MRYVEWRQLWAWYDVNYRVFPGWKKIFFTKPNSELCSGLSHHMRKKVYLTENKNSSIFSPQFSLSRLSFSIYFLFLLFSFSIFCFCLLYDFVKPQTLFYSSIFTMYVCCNFFLHAIFIVSKVVVAAFHFIYFSEV